ncbi:MAG: ATP-dependent DNA ligase, partial [Candidatus Micrarchaeota archaeon]
ILPALAERLPTPDEIIEKIGECAVEQKYDGLRLAVHKSGDRIEIFSRRQEKMTHMFPDVVDAVRKQVSAKEAIFEGEAVAFDEKTGVFLPFQETIQRKRKHGVGEKAKELPLKLFAFELLYKDGRDLTLLPYKERREALARVLKGGGVIELAKTVTARDAAALKKFFDECVSAGLEGIVAKDLKAPYTAGARKFAWIKLKKSYQTELADTLDLVIVGYYLGKGKRTQFGFGGLLAAAYSPKDRVFRTVCKIGTGFSEKQMQEFKKMLSEIEVAKKPDNVDSVLVPSKWVKPKHVIVVKADEITKSPTHTCCRKEGQGLALRFPRFMELRTDKAAEDATTEEEVMEMFEMQRQKKA